MLWRCEGLPMCLIFFHFFSFPLPFWFMCVCYVCGMSGRGEIAMRGCNCNPFVVADVAEDQRFRTEVHMQQSRE